MASVREKVAALNLAGKPRHGADHTHFSRAPPRRSAPDAAAAADEEARWRHVTCALRGGVKLKSRWQQLRRHDGCFPGSEAVDVVLTHLRGGAGGGWRRSAVRVCQLLLEGGAMEGVGSGVGGVFRDSGDALYRLLDVTGPVPHGFDSALLSAGEESETLPEVMSYYHSTPVTSPHQPLQLRLSGVPRPPGDTLPASVVREVWRTQTVLRLSRLVELPLLEGLLSCGDVVPPSGDGDSEVDLLYSSSYLDREVLKALRESQEDVWMSAAIDVLDFLPDQLVVAVSRELGAEPSQESKRLLFRALSEHYGRVEAEPLLCEGVAEVLRQAAGLLGCGRMERALEVLQMTLKLLRPAAREELRRLLCFMSVAADAAQVQLHKEVQNRVVVKTRFIRAVIHSGSVRRADADLLMLFMMDNHQDVFKIPGSLHQLVSEKLDELRKRGDVSSDSSTFCQRVSRDDCTRTARDQTRTHLTVLLKDIDEDPGLGVAEKRRLLGQFYRGHPELVSQYFGSRLKTLNLL